MPKFECYRAQSVAVTGGSGFIGRHLVGALIQVGARVQILGGHSEMESPLKSFRGRITQQLLESLPEKPSVLFHLAGGASVARSIENPHEGFERTVQATVEVLEYLRRANPACRLVYISSAAVYGNSTDEQLQPLSPYGLHKKISEELCEFYSNSYGITSRILRPFSVYGPGLRKQLLWDALIKIDLGNNQFFGTGQEVRDWVYVSDLARLILMAGDPTDPLGPDRIFDAGTGQGVTTEALLSQLLDLYSPGTQPVFIGTEKRGDPSRLIARANTPQIAEVLCSTSLAQGLQAYVSWFKSEKAAC